MSTPRLLPLACVVVVTLCEPACIQVPDIEPARAQVRFVAPEGTAYTNGALEVRLEVEGHPADRVELLRDGEVLAELEPPYTYRWETAEEAEGTYRLEARAVLGEVVFESEAREVVVDRTPPRLVSRTPEAGAEDVWVRAPIRAVFSEPLRAGTVSSESVRLTVGTVEVARTVSLSGDGRTLTVEPVTPITALNVVSLALSVGLMDLAGNAFSAPADTWSWAHPALLPFGSAMPEVPERSVQSAPSLLHDGSGGLLVARIESDSEGSHIRVYRRASAEWELLGNSLISRGSPFEPYNVTLMLDPASKKPVIAWHEGNGSNESERIYVARWQGASWEYLGGTAGAAPYNPYVRYPSMALSASGTAFVAFTDDSTASVHVSQWFNGSWQALGSSPSMSLGLISAGNLDIAISPAGLPVLAMTGTRNGSAGIYIAEWTGTEWRALNGNPDSTRLSLALASTFNARFFLDSAARPTVSWLSNSTTDQGVRAHARTWDGTGWTSRCSPLQLLTTHQIISANFSIDGTDTLWIAWNAPDYGSFKVERCRDASWSLTTSSTSVPELSSAAMYSFTAMNTAAPFTAIQVRDKTSSFVRVYGINH